MRGRDKTNLSVEHPGISVVRVAEMGSEGKGWAGLKGGGGGRKILYTEA